MREMRRTLPRGFAMISETRTVTLPPGRSTLRFEGVAEGMVAVSAIVTGLPGGTIEKNRNADLLSPAALLDGTLGNRVRITRTNPATGKRRANAPWSAPAPMAASCCRPMRVTRRCAVRVCRRD